MLNPENKVLLNLPPTCLLKLPLLLLTLLPHIPCPTHTRFLSAHPCSPYIKHTPPLWEPLPIIPYPVQIQPLPNPLDSASTWTSPLPLVTFFISWFDQSTNYMYAMPSHHTLFFFFSNPYSNL